jgi:hypothetical protein
MGEGRPSHASDVLLLGTGVQSEHRELEHGERGDRVSALGRLRCLRFIECDFAAALRSRHTHACSGSQHRHASDVGLPGSRRRRARQTHGRVRLAETGVGIRGNEPHLKHARWDGRTKVPSLRLCNTIVVAPNGLHAAAKQRSAYGDTPTARPPPKMRTTARQA